MSSIDELMDFNPTEMSAFQPKEAIASGDAMIYKTNPVKDSRSEDGIYRSRIRLLLNPYSPKESIVPQTTYFLATKDGNRLVRSKLSKGDKSCPIFNAWKSTWYPENPTNREFAKDVFNKSESQWVTVQILEDINQPELVGKFRVMKLAKDIYEKLNARMNPSAGSKNAPYPVMDYLIGLELNMEVKPGPDDPTNPGRKQRETSYSLCDFGQYSPIIKTDGTSLLTDEEIEIVDTYVTAINDMQYGKTEKKREEGKATVATSREKIRPIYEKVVKYVEENLVDQAGKPLNVSEYCGYKEWDENTAEFVNRFIEMTSARVNPRNVSYAEFRGLVTSAPTQSTQPTQAAPTETPAVEPNNSGLPF